MEELLERESRCRTLETRLESTKGEILAAMKTRDNALQRIKQLEEDMKVMTRENQVLFNKPFHLAFGTTKGLYETGASFCELRI